jgi:hypothetical protein
MTASFQLQAANGPQIINMADGSIGVYRATLIFDVAPSAGTVVVEKQGIGSTIWETLSASTSITSGKLDLSFDGAIRSMRVTFAGLIGGTRPLMWVTGQAMAVPPLNILTDKGIGPNSRMRVDVGQTGFFSGRMFRNYLEALIPVAGPSVQFRFTSPIDFILWQQSLELTQGALDMRVYTGATQSGVWVDKTPIGVNRMSERPQPFYDAQCRFATGGNFTGGTEVDLLKIRASAANNTASNVGVDFSERGLPAGVYHGRFTTLTGGVTVNDAAQMIYSLMWEERAQ